MSAKSPRTKRVSILWLRLTALWSFLIPPKRDASGLIGADYFANYGDFKRVYAYWLVLLAMTGIPTSVLLYLNFPKIFYLFYAVLGSWFLWLLWGGFHARGILEAKGYRFSLLQAAYIFRKGIMIEKLPPQEELRTLPGVGDADWDELPPDDLVKLAQRIDEINSGRMELSEEWKKIVPLPQPVQTTSDGYIGGA